MTREEWEQHIGSRVTYTGRNNVTRVGTLRGVAGAGSTTMLDLNLDGATRPVFYVPSDACKLIPPELESTL